MIKTTHVGSLPRPAEMHTQQLKKQEITQDDLKHYVTTILDKQVSLGLTMVNNGELPRSDYVQSTMSRISGFFDQGTAPIPKDMEELPDYARKFGARNALITLNPKAPVKLPACSSEISFQGEASLREELEMMTEAFQSVKAEHPESASQLFFTAPSPGTLALFLENQYYPDYKIYLEHLGKVLKKEYEIINGYGLILQIDCPDLAMGRHTRFRNLSDKEFLSIVDMNIGVLNQALINIDAETCRAHICWGNYPGTHHCDIDLDIIFDHVMQVDAKFISLEASNHRHAHEWEIFKEFPFPENKVLLPGVIDTTSNTVEHPKLVAQRILNYVNILGADRVIASTDCGFSSTASATSVSGEVAWLKLQSLVEGAKIASLNV